MTSGDSDKKYTPDKRTALEHQEIVRSVMLLTKSLVRSTKNIKIDLMNANSG